MTPAGRDVAKNRERIEAAARQLLSRGENLGLNSVARAADVGVATVYRHFATVEELEETLVWDQFSVLDSLLQGTGPGQLERALSVHFQLLAEDALFERVTSRQVPALARTAELRDSLIARLDSVLVHARTDGEIRADVDAGMVLVLLCGVAHSARMAKTSSASGVPAIPLRVLLDGLQVSARETA